MPVWFNPQCQQRGSQDQDDGNSPDSLVQGLRQEVHAAESKVQGSRSSGRMNIVALAFDLAKAVEEFISKAKTFYHHVILLGYVCPRCQGPLSIVAEGQCRCHACGSEFDPTEEFQRCPACGGKIRLRIRRYQCRECGADVRSRFLFDGLAFDSQYFKAKMVESRQRKREQRERVRQMLAESRSDTLELGSVDLDSVPDLVEALNQLTNCPEKPDIPAIAGFDLKRYEQHIKDHLSPHPVSLTNIPSLSQNRRKDLIWRFIAVIFLAHAGKIDVWQEGQAVRVKKHETDRERCSFSGESEKVDGIEGSLGGVEAG